MIRPHLEYCHAITHPRLARQMNDIEGVLRRASKQIAEIRDLPYSRRLQILKLPSMKYRLKRGNMVEVYKYLRSGYAAQHEDISLTISSSITRGHRLKLVKPRCASTLRLKTFPNRIIDSWNELLEHVAGAPSLNCFKARLDGHWANIMFEIEYLKP